MSSLLSTLLFGDDEEFKSFLGDDLEGFNSMDQQLATSDHPASLVPYIFLMGEEDEAASIAEEASMDVESDHHHDVVNADSVEDRLEEVRIEGSGLTCAVCLEQLAIGSEAKRLPCSHIYHGNCIEQWIKNSNTCPLCRCQISS